MLGLKPSAGTRVPMSTGATALLGLGSVSGGHSQKAYSKLEALELSMSTRSGRNSRPSSRLFSLEIQKPEIAVAALTLSERSARSQRPH